MSQETQQEHSAIKPQVTAGISCQSCGLIHPTIQPCKPEKFVSKQREYAVEVFKNAASCNEIVAKDFVDHIMAAFAEERLGRPANRPAQVDESVVRKNLLSRVGYVPYCGAERCRKLWPRTSFNHNVRQFVCGCGWSSSFEASFIEKYLEFVGEQ